MQATRTTLPDVEGTLDAVSRLHDVRTDADAGLFELAAHFAGFVPDGAPADEPVLQGAGDPAFLSNVNAAYRRACWEQIRFRDVPYAEDQAFGADLLAGCSSIVFDKPARQIRLTSTALPPPRFPVG